MSDFVRNCGDFLNVLLLPFPQAWKDQLTEKKTSGSTTALQNAGRNRLLDLNVIGIIAEYYGCDFAFTSEDVKVNMNIAWEDCVQDVTLRSPTHLCELADGCIAVAEGCGGGLICIFRGDALVQTIGRGILSCTSGICTNSKNQIIVTETYRNQVHVFARNGSHVRSFGSKGSGEGQFDEPWGVCVNSQGHILVADCSNHRICVFDSEGKFVRNFGSQGSGDGEMKHPYGVSVDHKDNVYVTEDGNHRVSKFSSDDTFVCTFGSYGSGPGQLKSPHDACVTRDGRYLVVADSSNHRIQVLSGVDGSFVASYGSGGYDVEGGCFQFTSGCVVTRKGHILVCDFVNNRVHMICAKKN